MTVRDPSPGQSEPTTPLRKPWIAPRIRRLEAGAAENGPGGSPDTLSPPS